MRWLRIMGFVGGTALEDRLCAIPNPRESEAGLTDWKHWVLQRGEIPRLAAIDRDFDSRDPASARPSQPGDLVEAGAWKPYLPRWERDHGLGFHRK